MTLRSRSRAPLRAKLIEDLPKIANGMLKLKAQPGLGLTLWAQTVKKFGERILEDAGLKRLKNGSCRHSSAF